MIRLAHIKDGYIVNVSMHNADNALPADTMPEADALAAGYSRLVEPTSTLYPDAENYQIRAWMIRGDFDPDVVPQIISQVITDEKEKREALMRWDYAVRIPRNFPLVNIIGSQMGLSPEQINSAWPDILSL